MILIVSKLWDYADPELSEQRFRSALSAASADDALILQTQITRTYGLRGDFTRAQEILAEIEPHIQNAIVEARVRYCLELGQTYASAAHPPESQNSEVKVLARSAYLHALDLAQANQLNGLAIDALHMMTFVDTAPEDQLGWNQKALRLMQDSSQQDAKNWEGSLHKNTGYALHLLGRYEEALTEFKPGLAARVSEGSPKTIRIAHWMIAWSLRSLGRLEEAVEIQLQLERECDEAGETDPYVYEELELLYRALNNHERFDYSATRRKESVVSMQ